MERFINNNDYKKLPDYKQFMSKEIIKDYTKVNIEQYDGGIYKNSSYGLIDKYAKNLNHIGITKAENVFNLQNKIKNNENEFNAINQKIKNL